MFWEELISRCPSHFVSCGQKGVKYICQLKNIKSLVDLMNCIKQIAKPDCQLSFCSGSVRTVPVSARCVTPGSAGTESETGRCLLCISVSSDAGSWTIKPKTSSDDLNRAQSFLRENLNQSKVPVFVTHVLTQTCSFHTLVWNLVTQSKFCDLILKFNHKLYTT